MTVDFTYDDLEAGYGFDGPEVAITREMIAIQTSFPRRRESSIKNNLTLSLSKGEVSIPILRQGEP